MDPFDYDEPVEYPWESEPFGDLNEWETQQVFLDQEYEDYEMAEDAHLDAYWEDRLAGGGHDLDAF